jgi:NAD(P)-dependent dehydrogenase (short-subunit alcohol dehydrogenase family)
MADTIAVVTGASRGLGRGIARALGGKGMTVYLTGRDGDALREAAAEVRQAGGTGIAVICDHGDDAQVADLFARVTRDSSRLDLLVNNAAAVYAQELSRPGPFWEKDLRLVDMIDIGLRSDYVAAYHAAPLMIASGPSLIVNISFYGAVSYFHGPAYGAAKAGTDKMVYDMAVDFAPTPVSIVSLWPGYILTDMLKAIPRAAFPAAMQAMLPEFETPEYTGLVAAALLADPDLKSYSGKTLIGALIGRQYGIIDLDGKRPRDWSETLGAPTTFFATPARN